MHKIPLMLTEGDVRRDEMWWCTPSQQGGAVCHRGLKEQRAWNQTYRGSLNSQNAATC